MSDEEFVARWNHVTDKGRTICEVHREMFDALYELYRDQKLGADDAEILFLLEEAYIMAKKMDAKLRQYKFDYDDEWWEKERESILEEKLSTRAKRGSDT